MKKNRWLPGAAFTMLFAGGSILLAGCNDQGNSAAQAQPPAQTVEVLTVKTEPVNIVTVLPARTSAFHIAEIRPQVGGTILQREFVEGGNVESGQSLYLIDPAPYQAALDSAKGNLASAKASAEVNRLTVSRYKSLLGSRSISQQEYDMAVSTATQANAAVQVAESTLETARINLAYTRVYAPISGRIGKSNVTVGALVTANQATPLATVQQLDPIYVDMTQSAVEYLRMRQEIESGVLQQENGKAVVQLIMDNGKEYAHQGTLEFSDVSVNETTGSISLRAIFPNPENTLLPGMFVRASLHEGTIPNGILIPQKVLTRDTRGNAFVKIVNKEGVVETRQVNATRTIGTNWLIESGLSVGDQVITLGLLRVGDGQPVQVAQPAEKPAATAEQQPNQAQ